MNGKYKLFWDGSSFLKNAQVLMGHEIPVFLKNNAKLYADEDLTLTEILHRLRLQSQKLVLP